GPGAQRRDQALPRAVLAPRVEKGVSRLIGAISVGNPVPPPALPEPPADTVDQLTPGPVAGTPALSPRRGDGQQRLEQGPLRIGEIAVHRSLPRIWHLGQEHSRSEMHYARGAGSYHRCFKIFLGAARSAPDQRPLNARSAPGQRS